MVCELNKSSILTEFRTIDIAALFLQLSDNFLTFHLYKALQQEEGKLAHSAY